VGCAHAALAALVIGVIVMPTVFQQIWGRPDIKIRFEDAANEHQQQVLQCTLINERITNRCLRALRVRRDEAFITGHVHVREARSSATISQFIPDLLAVDGSSEARRTLHTSSVDTGLFFLIAISGAQTGAFLLDKAKTTLPSGAYTATVFVDYGDAPPLMERRRFIVGENQLYWG